MKFFVCTKTFTTDERVVVLLGQVFVVVNEDLLPISYHGQRYFQEYELLAGQKNE